MGGSFPLERLMRGLVRARDYVFFERNPSVQVLYFAAMGSCYYLYLREAYPLLPNEYVAWYHKWLATLLFSVSIVLYVVMCASDPGVIRHDNIHEFKHYVSHPVLYPEDKFCRTCKTLKLPRSKHCRMCDHCVGRFDHQYASFVGGSVLGVSSYGCVCCCEVAVSSGENQLCGMSGSSLVLLFGGCEVWFNGCVGEKNYKYFLMYLLAQFAVCLEGFFLTSSVFLVQADDIFHSRGVTMEDAGRSEAANLLHSLISHNQALGFVTAMCLMTSVILWVFILMQLKRILQNETANESFKREDLREEAELDGETSGRRMFRFLFKRLRFRQRPKLAVPRRELKKTLDASWGGLFSPDSIMNTEESFSVEDVDYNPYKLGSFKANLLDALHLRGPGKEKAS